MMLVIFDYVFCFIDDVLSNEACFHVFPAEQMQAICNDETAVEQAKKQGSHRLNISKKALLAEVFGKGKGVQYSIPTDTIATAAVWQQLTIPLPSNRQHSEINDCLEDNREDY